MKTNNYIYWEDGSFIGRHKVHKTSETEGTIPDGRPVHLINGRWIYLGE